MLEGGEDGRGKIGELGLPHQVLLQRCFADKRIEEVLAFLGILGGVGLGAADAGHVIAPVFVEFAENFEFLVLGKIHLVALGVGFTGSGRRRFGGIATGLAAGIGVAVGGVFLGRFVEAHTFHRQLLE